MANWGKALSGLGGDLASMGKTYMSIAEKEEENKKAKEKEDAQRRLASIISDPNSTDADISSALATTGDVSTALSLRKEAKKEEAPLLPAEVFRLSGGNEKDLPKFEALKTRAEREDYIKALGTKLSNDFKRQELEFKGKDQRLRMKKFEVGELAKFGNEVAKYEQRLKEYDTQIKPLRGAIERAKTGKTTTIDETALKSGAAKFLAGLGPVLSDADIAMLGTESAQGYAIEFNNWISGGAKGKLSNEVIRAIAVPLAAKIEDYENFVNETVFSRLKSLSIDAEEAGVDIEKIRSKAKYLGDRFGIEIKDDYGVEKTTKSIQKDDYAKAASSVKEKLDKKEITEDQYNNWMAEIKRKSSEKKPFGPKQRQALGL